jgi:hypothetical protein
MVPGTAGHPRCRPGMANRQADGAVARRRIYQHCIPRSRNKMSRSILFVLYLRYYAHNEFATRSLHNCAFQGIEHMLLDDVGR